MRGIEHWLPRAFHGRVVLVLTMALLNIISGGLAAVFVFLVHVYRWTLSPLKRAVFGEAAGCRFSPSCSRYALDCFRQLPLHRALFCATYRILRCNPWGGSGYDPAPRVVLHDKNVVPDGKRVTSLKDVTK